jgi:hypothetical protein
MSDVSQGVGWWLASDGKWYPPTSVPGTAPAAPPPPSGQQPYQQPSKPKKGLLRRPLFWILVVIVVFFGGCIAIVAGGTKAVNDAAKKKHTVVYSVTGSGTTTADVTYSTLQEGSGQNGTAQVTNASLPWTKNITASGLFTSFTLTVTNGPVGLSYVTCSITVDGKVVSQNKASGPYASADCNGTS